MSVISIVGGESDQGIRWEIDLGGDRHDVYLKSHESLALNDSSFPLALFSSMIRGEPVETPAPCCETLFEGSKKIATQFRHWFPGFAEPRFANQRFCLRDKKEGSRVGVFFTGGVDSFYSLIENLHEVTDLIFVHGFDIKLANHAFREEVSQALREVARHFGKNLIEVETNVRRYLDTGLKLSWPYSHGVALAVVAHSLSHLISRVYLPSSHTYPDLTIWGTHPQVDPHWSSAALQVIHHGFQATRVDKVRRIERSEFALSKLRVCYENKSKRYNCGECEKCVRTMLAMKITGCLDRSSVFSRPFDSKSLALIDRFDSVHRYYLLENRNALSAAGGDPELLQQLDALLAPPSLLERALREIRHAKPVRRTVRRVKRWKAWMDPHE